GFSGCIQDDWSLCVTDGTDAGTRVVYAGMVGPGYPTELNGALYFGGGSSGQRQLWRSDGTGAGTVLVKDADIAAPGLVKVGGQLFFSSFSELQMSDGTTAGTVPVPGAPVGGVGDLREVNGRLFFTGYDAAGGAAVWRSDGTASGTGA